MKKQSKFYNFLVLIAIITALISCKENEKKVKIKTEKSGISKLEISKMVIIFKQKMANPFSG